MHYKTFLFAAVVLLQAPAMTAAAVAQIQGHKPSATAEKHYTIRPLELPRVHPERIEASMLEQAVSGALRMVG